MKKVFLISVIVFAFICIMSSCSNNDSSPASPAGATSTNTTNTTPQATSTATPWATIGIQAVLKGQDNAGTAGINPMPLAWCDIYVSENLTPCPDATVLVNSTPVPQVTQGYFSLSNTQGYFAAGQTATIKVTINGVDFTASAVYPGGQTFTASTHTVSWLYEGNKDMVVVYESTNIGTPLYTTGSGSNANSPVALSSALFTNPGTYYVRMYAWDRQYGTISGPGVSAASYIELLGLNFMTHIVD